MSIEKPIQGSYIMAALSSLVGNSEFHDVIIKVGEKTMHAHSLILAARSTVFADILYGPSQIDEGTGIVRHCRTKTIEKKVTMEVVTIENVTEEVFEIMLSYIYTDQLTLESHNVVGVLFAASQYNLTILQHQCVNYISDKINPSNALLFFGELYKGQGFLPLKESVTKYILDHFYIHFNEPQCLTVIQDRATLKILVEKLAAIEHAPDNGRFEYDMFVMLIQWSREKCNNDKIPDNLENIKMCLDGMEDYLKLDRMDQRLYHHFYRLYPTILSPNDLQTYFNKKNPNDNIEDYKRQF